MFGIFHYVYYGGLCPIVKDNHFFEAEAKHCINSYTEQLLQSKR